MATQPNTVNFLLEQMASAGEMKARKMFGEYALYCDERVVALVCDDKLFLKPTKAGRAFLGDVTEGLPYPSAKPYFLIAGEKWDDGDWLSTLVRVSARELPLPEKKAPRGFPKNCGL
jgi:TfoX/Sxy family transcriptional regulator of competence genes